AADAKRSTLRTGPHLPYVDICPLLRTANFAGRGQQLSVGRPGYGPPVGGFHAEGGEAFLRAYVPEPDLTRSVCHSASRGQARAIGGKGQRPGPVRVSREDAARLTRSRAPQADGAAVACRG